jgi:hypothetical protein
MTVFALGCPVCRSTTTIYEMGRTDYYQCVRVELDDTDPCGPEIVAAGKPSIERMEFCEHRTWLCGQCETEFEGLDELKPVRRVKR